MGFVVYGSGFRVPGSVSRAHGSGSRVQGLGVGLEGVGFGRQTLSWAWITSSSLSFARCSGERILDEDGVPLYNRLLAHLLDHQV